MPKTKNEGLILTPEAEDRVLYSKICLYCKHLISGTEEKCDAFPDGIPYEIWKGDNDHKKPYPGDHGIQFEPK